MLAFGCALIVTLSIFVVTAPELWSERIGEISMKVTLQTMRQLPSKGRRSFNSRAKRSVPVKGDSTRFLEGGFCNQGSQLM